MFTGLVSDVGRVESVAETPAGRRFRIACAYPARGIPIGASIACAGVCLTVVSRGPEEPPAPGEGWREVRNMQAWAGAVAAVEGPSWFEVDVSVETLARTTLGTWAPDTRVNLERSLKVGDELGGHLVTGHVDGVAEILDRGEIADAAWGRSARFSLRAPRALAAFIAGKGSVTLDGTSLTVNAVERDAFSILLIPHSLAVTTWGERRAGDRVNLEVDLMARYAARLAEAKAAGY